MIYSNITSNLKLIALVLFSTLFAMACSDDPVSDIDDELRSETSTYAFNEGQALDDNDSAYRGEHDRNLEAELMIEEMENGNASITVTLNNTISGEEYAVHAHDMADPATTENGTPYNETPNADVFAGAIEGNGSSASLTNDTDISYDEIINEYEAFFVVHDPLQDISTVDLTTYLVLGVFGQSLGAGESSLRSESFSYAFNEGQALDDPESAYDASGEEGDHPRNLTAELLIEERGTGEANVTVTLNNTIDGEEYAVHAHDMADPNETPNGTPYDETPNGDVFAQAIAGNGNSATATNETDLNYLELIEEYEAFFVVHDPTQAISTTDLTTYLILGVFGETLDEGEPNLRSETIEYSFNEGQALDDPDTAYEGDHARDLSVTMVIDEEIDGTSTINVTINNAINGETYPVHSHDFADPDTTENGTPYDETPNGDIFVADLEADGGEVTGSNQTNLSFNELTREYGGFFVVHDPLQALSTTDLTTYLILGETARGLD